MSENEIKPVAWVDLHVWLATNDAGDSFFTDYQDEDTVAVYDQSAIDLLREDLAEIRSQRDRAELLVEARGTCIDRLTAERDAAVAEMQAIRKAVGNEMLARFIDKHGDPVPLVVELESYKADAERLRRVIHYALAQHYYGGHPRQNHWAAHAQSELAAIDAARSEGGV